MEKLILLTGAAGGIGSHLVRELTGQHHRLVATDYSLGVLEEVAREQRWPPSVILRELDVRDEAGWQTLFEQVETEFGRVDILMNVAGVLKPGTFIHEETESYERHFDVNVRGVFLGTREAGRRMVARGQGHIINIASLAGITPVPGLAIYCASKHAVRGMTLAAAMELKPKGVAVSVVCPDAVDTAMFDVQIEFDEAALTFSSEPLTTEEVVRVVVDDVMVSRRLEAVVAKRETGRAITAKFASAFPEAAARIEPFFRKKGLEALAKIRSRGRT